MVWTPDKVGSATIVVAVKDAASTVEVTCRPVVPSAGSVFNTTAPGTALGGTPVTVLNMFGDTLRALARNAAGTRVANVSFGSTAGSAPFTTLENVPGVDGTISTRSAVGVNSAFLSAQGSEVGSPGAREIPQHWRA